MKRKFYNTLLEWKNKKHHKPLIVKGPRQVGKTYIIDKFCEENYTNVFKFDRSILHCQGTNIYEEYQMCD